MVRRSEIEREREGGGADLGTEQTSSFQAGSTSLGLSQKKKEDDVRRPA
jgi:hypothetical protein